MIEGAEQWDAALRALSAVIAQPDNSTGIQEAVRECLDAETAFVATARHDLDGLDIRPRGPSS